MKVFILAVTMVLLTSCYFNDVPKTAIYDDREGLAIAFTTDVDSLLTEDEFAIYVQALKFTFDEINTGSNLEWTGPEVTFGGNISIINEELVDGNPCKEFKQQMTYKEIKYTGLAKACKKGSTWELHEIK